MKIGRFVQKVVDISNGLRLGLVGVRWGVVVEVQSGGGKKTVLYYGHAGGSGNRGGASKGFVAEAKHVEKSVQECSRVDEKFNFRELLQSAHKTGSWLRRWMELAR